eukprot:scaffold4990_cov387-Prasinococcus_capsulatus_cf.AAC.35
MPVSGSSRQSASAHHRARSLIWPNAPGRAHWLLGARVVLLSAHSQLVLGGHVPTTHRLQRLRKKLG